MGASRLRPSQSVMNDASTSTANAATRAAVKIDATFSPQTAVCTAPISDHTANASPRTTITPPPAIERATFRRFERSSDCASAGMTPSSLPTRSDTPEGPLISVRSPSPTSNADGIAKNALNATPLATLDMLSESIRRPARTTAPRYSSGPRSVNIGSVSVASRCFFSTSSDEGPPSRKRISCHSVKDRSRRSIRWSRVKARRRKLARATSSATVAPSRSHASFASPRRSTTLRPLTFFSSRQASPFTWNGLPACRTAGIWECADAPRTAQIGACRQRIAYRTPAESTLSVRHRHSGRWCRSLGTTSMRGVPGAGHVGPTFLASYVIEDVKAYVLGRRDAPWSTCLRVPAR